MPKSMDQKLNELLREEQRKHFIEQLRDQGDLEAALAALDLFMVLFAKHDEALGKAYRKIAKLEGKPWPKPIVDKRTPEEKERARKRLAAAQKGVATRQKNKQKRNSEQS